MTVETEDTLQDSRSAVVRRLLLLALAAVALGVAAHFLPLRQWLTSFQHSIAGAGVAGALMYALVYALCCVFLVPGSLLTLGAGALFGLMRGTLVVVGGATLGAIASFALGRSLLREKIRKLIAGNARFEALDRAVAKEGAKIVFLVRLAPIFPFTYVNYLFGLTGVAPLAYSAATFVGIIPGTIAFVYLGYAAAGAAAGSGGTLRLTLQIVGAIATLLVTLFVARLARNAIKRAGA